MLTQLQTMQAIVNGQEVEVRIMNSDQNWSDWLDPWDVYIFDHYHEWRLKPEITLNLYKVWDCETCYVVAAKDLNSAYRIVTSVEDQFNVELIGTGVVGLRAGTIR